MLAKIISGGQTGVDQAALRAARECGLPTGGTAAKEWQTEDGPAPWLEEFGLVECERLGYPARTFANVKAAGLCVLLWAEGQEHSRGTSLTRIACQQHGVELFEAGFWLVGVRSWRTTSLRVAALADTIRRVRPDVLMIAGNRESGAPGIGAAAAEAFLREVFGALCRTVEG